MIEKVRKQAEEKDNSLVKKQKEAKKSLENLVETQLMILWIINQIFMLVFHSS